MFLVIGCKNEGGKLVPTFKPKIITLTADIPDEGGVIFSGELKRPDNITNHGFYYSEDSLFRNNNYVKISLDKPEKSGKFEAIVETGLKKNTVYFFKAFITVGDEEIYGETKPFLSNGSIPPVIDFVLPEKAHLDDTINIYGEHFGQNNYYSNVYFNEIKARVLSRSDSVITCIIPVSLYNYKSKIIVTAYDKSDSIDYSLYTPIIERFSPKNATFRDTISIFGNHFDNSINRNVVKLNNLSTEIIYSSRTQIDFVIPDDLNDSTSIVKLFSQVQWVESQDEFKLLPHRIDSIPLCTYTNQNIQIIGEYFHPLLYKNKVFIENIEAEVISGDVKSLLVKVPEGPFPRGQAKVSIQIANYNIKAKRDICILDPWLMISNTLPFGFDGDVGSFTIDNIAYVFSNPNVHDLDIALWKYNASADDWTKIDVPFGVDGCGACASNSTKGYLYNTGDNNNFWEYDPVSNEWLQKADFPGESRNQAASFSIGDNIFIGSGVSYGPGGSSQAHCDFYKYNPSTDSWSQVSDLAVDYCYNRYRASTFVIDDIAYLAAGASGTGMNDVWKYISSTDEWIEVASLPDARLYTSSFSLNGKGYIANGSLIGGGGGTECWEYNPLSNSWNQIDDIGHKSRNRGFAFTVNDTAYVGGGYGDYRGNGTCYELFKLVP